MARISWEDRTSRTETYDLMRRAADAFNDTNDCTVRALAVLCDLPYCEAHKLMEEQGREKGRGAYDYQWKAAFKNAGVKLEKIHPMMFIAKYPGNHKSLKSVTTHHPKRFNSVWADGHRYLFRVRGHVAAVVNGVMHDWASGNSKRCYEIYRVVKIDA